MTEGTSEDRVPADLALIAARLGAELRDAGVPADPGRCERFARAVPLARPATKYELYLCALATFASGPEQTETVRRVFTDLFGGVDGRAPGQSGPEAPDLPGPPPGRPPMTCSPRPRGPRRSTRLRRQARTGRPTRRAGARVRQRVRRVAPRMRRSRTRTSRRPPARPWPAGSSGWRARTSPS